MRKSIIHGGAGSGRRPRSAILRGERAESPFPVSALPSTPLVKFKVGAFVSLAIEQVLLVAALTCVNPFRAAVSFWGQFGTNYLEFDWRVPRTGLEF